MMLNEDEIANAIGLIRALIDMERQSLLNPFLHLLQMSPNWLVYSYLFYIQRSKNGFIKESDTVLTTHKHVPRCALELHSHRNT